VPDFSGLPRTAAGSMGDEYSALALDMLENVPALTYPLSIQTFSRMRRDPQISAVLKAYTLPMRSASYAINPRGCRDEIVELVADAWGLPIAGDNDGPGPARRRGVMWDDHLRLALLMLPFGHSPFAIRYEVAGNPMRAQLAELAERLPQTITDIETNDDGSLKGIYQNGYTANGKPRLIPAKDLLWYAHEREGAAWQGRSMIAESYGPWLLKHEMWRVLGQSSRRFGMGIPEVQTGPNPTPADVTTAAEIASRFRSGDQTGAGVPNGWSFNLKGMSGSTPDTMGFINYLDAQIATSVLAEVLNLDTSANGSRALGDTVIGLLQMSWGAVAREITGPATKLNIQIVDYNFGEDEPVPAILCTDINRPEVTSEAISALVTCGALTPDLGMENDLRNRYQLPVIQDSARQTARTPAPVEPPAPMPAPGAGRTNEQVPADA
jgi:hypothetical protein